MVGKLKEEVHKLNSCFSFISCFFFSLSPKNPLFVTLLLIFLLSALGRACGCLPNLPFPPQFETDCFIM